MSRLPASAQAPRRRSAFLTIALVFLTGVFVARLPSTLASIGLRPDFFEPIRDVQRIIQAEAVDAPDVAKMQQGAIDGMLESLDDAYAEYIPADDRKEFEKQMTGSFVGIGCQIEMRDKWLTVVSPLEDSPALDAGIIANDRIKSIEGKETFGLTADACIKMLTGEPGTPVNIVIERAGQEIPLKIIREKIVSKSVKGLRRLSDGSGHWDFLLDPENKIGYIRLTQFIPTSSREFRDGVEAAKSAAGGDLNGLIIDLRNNPGGVMEAALQIANMFIDEGVIMSIKGRTGEGESFSASPRGRHFDFPVAILVNQNSASASEIVSGSLQDHNRATVIGTRTFGKGLVQSVQPLPHDPGAALKLTTQRYYLPSGRLIQRTNDATVWGVDPTPGFFVPITDDEMLAWLLLRRDWDVLTKADQAPREGQEAIPHPDQQHWTDPAWIKGTAKDIQLAAAVAAMQGRVAAGKWTPISDEAEQHGKIAMNELRILERTRDRMGKEFVRIEKRIDTLESIASTGKGSAEPTDLWADKVDPTGGRIEVYDKQGNRITELRITGRDLERWLAMSDVEAVKDQDKAATPMPDPDASAKSPTPAPDPHQ